MAGTFVPIPIAEIDEAEETSSLTYRLDLDKGRIVGKVDGLKAVEQAIRKAILTPRFKCLIYDNQYGSEIEDTVIAKDATPEYIETAVEGFIIDALKPDTRILSVSGFSFHLKGDAAYISFKCDTIFGETSVEEVIGNV